MAASTVPAHVTPAYVTLDAFYQMDELPECGAELANGEVVVTPPPDIDHGYLARTLFRAMDAHAVAHGLGDVFGDNIGYELPVPGRPDTLRIPDLSFVRAGRIPRPRLYRRAFTFAPDVAVEIRSPSDTPGVMRRKLADYMDSGTGAVWVIDDEARTVEVHAPGAPVRVLREPDALDGAALLPGFTLPLARLFAELDD